MARNKRKTNTHNTQGTQKGRLDKSSPIECVGFSEAKWQETKEKRAPKTSKSQQELAFKIFFQTELYFPNP